MKPFTKGALDSALWWIPAGMVLMLIVQVAAVSLLGGLMASGNLPALDALPDHGEFDYAWSISTLDGDEISMEEFRGKTLFFNQWATWCMPCVLEIPSIDHLYRSIDNENVVVPDSLFNETIPFTVIADPTGTIRFEHDGAADYDTDSARTFLVALAGGDSI